MAALGPELSKATGRRLWFDKQTVDRQIIVARGACAATSARIDIFSEDSRSQASGARDGDTEAFLGVLGDLLKTRVINETDTNTLASLRWIVHRDASSTKISDRTEKVLENISNQTGLKFDHETRPVQVWFLSEKR